MNAVGGFLIERNTMRFVLFTVMGLASVALYSVRVTPPLVALVGLGILWISLLPGVIYLFSQDRAQLPYVPALGLFYAVFYGLPVFTIPLAWYDASSIILYGRATLPIIRVEVLIVVLVGILSLFAAFFISQRFLFKHLPRFRFLKITDQLNISPLLWLLLISHQIFEFNPNQFNIYSIGQFLDPVGYVAFGGFFLLWQRKLLSRPEAVLVLCIFFPIEMYLRLRQLFLTDILLFIIFCIFILWREKKYKLIGLSAVLVIVVLSGYGASSAVRATENFGVTRMIVAVKAYAELMIYGKEEIRDGEIAVLNRKKGKKFDFEGKFGSLVKRTSHLWVFHIVDDKSPKTTPYWQGKSYLPVFTSFIPRALYPNKPEERIGYKFGTDFGFITPADTHMSINLPWITELLVNFGKQGVIIGMIWIGMFLAFLDRIFNSSDATDLEFVIGLTLIFPLVYPESNFSLMTGSMLPLFVSLFVYFTGGSWILKRIGWRIRSRST